MKVGKRLLSSVLALVMICSTIFTSNVFAASAPTAEKQEDKAYTYEGKWIWSDDGREAGQWMSFRKSFELNKIPEKVEARIAADSKYWLWINGEQVVFEGMVKTGPNRSDMYYDPVDITKYLKTGTNTIAVQVIYFGKNGYGFKDSGQGGFLFDADFGENALSQGTRVVSDTSWKVIKDPAYQKHDIEPNYRLAEPNILYNANQAMNGWTGTSFDDSKWKNAVVKASVGDAPYNNLEERPIPQLKVDEIVKYTADGQNGTQKWKVEEMESTSDTFTPLSLPDEYQVTVEFMVEPYALGNNYPPLANSGSFGLAVAMQDADNFYMPQVSMADLESREDFANYKPHIRQNGNWNVPFKNNISTIITPEQRFNTKHTMVVDVDANGFDAAVDDTKMKRVDVTGLKNGSVGFRNDPNELVRVYSMKVTSMDGKETYFEDTFQTDSLGTRMSQFSKISGNTSPQIKEDEQGTKYLFLKDSIVKAGTVTKGEGTKKYTIRNATNLQGTPYLKVKAKEGQRIDMYTDTWKETAGNGDSIRHAYITKEGEQEFEAYGWINGYDVYFEIPESVEVLELGFRPSTYNTKPAGSFTSEDEDLNTLYQKSYDTLLVTMRDNYMDCPDRERAQWWGDAVNEMQMAFYAMDSNAGLLYKKALNQVLGWKNDAGQLPTTAPNGVDAISELPMQALAGVMSFWQYYMYSGDTQPLEDGYDSLLNYLKLWSVDPDGLIGHRGGTWDWMDWGNNPDAKIIEQCWYYIAAGNVKKIAQLLGKPEADITFLDERMEGISSVFDKKFWNDSMKAYYNSTGNKLPDDRANALAVYAGLAPQKRHEDIKNILGTRMESSPYMEKYVLEVLYMMGYDDEAMSRTKTRYKEMIEDEFPTLWEFWNKLAGTKNHAWSGGPLTMMYMFNAGLTPLTAGYETFQIRPLTAGLKNVQAKIPSPSGEIAVSIVEAENGEITLKATVPAGAASADIYVPRTEAGITQIALGDSTIYKNGSVVKELPGDITYIDEDDRFVGFRVPSGEYTFVSKTDTTEEKEEYSVNINKSGEGTITVDGTAVNAFPYTVSKAKASSVSIVATPADGWQLKKIIGTYPENLNSKEAVTKEYTANNDITYTAVFEKLPKEKYTLSIDAPNYTYAASVMVNGIERRLPFEGSFYDGTEIQLEAKIANDTNYSFNGWDGIESQTGEIAKLVMGRADHKVTLKVTENSTVEKIPLTVTKADNSGATGSWDKSKLSDGIRISTSESNGFTTAIYHSDDISNTPHEIVMDLGEEKSFNQVALFPRTNAVAAGDRMSCGFPTDFTIAVSKDGENYKTVRTMVDYPNPRFLQQNFSFATQTARYIKITTTKLGLVATDEGSATFFRLQLAELEVYNNSAVDLPSKDELAALLKEADEVKKTDTYHEATTRTKAAFDESYLDAYEAYADPDADYDMVKSAQSGLRDAIDGLTTAYPAVASVTAEGVTYNQVLLSWDEAVSDDYGPAVYQVTQGEELLIQTDKTSALLVQLEEKKEYTLNVTAVYENGEKAVSTEVIFTTGEKTGEEEPSEAVQTKDETTGVEVRAEENVLPTDTAIGIESVQDEKALDLITESLKNVADDFQAIDLSFALNDNPLVLNGSFVQVTMDVPEGFDRNQTAVFFVGRDGIKEQLETKYTDETKSRICFSVSKNGYYAVANHVMGLVVLDRVTAGIKNSGICWGETTSIQNVQAYDTQNSTLSMDYVAVSYQSEDETVAAVDAEGSVTGKNTGSTNILVTVAFEGKEATGKVQVTVEEPLALTPVVLGKTDTSITLKAVEGYEYILETAQGDIISQTPVFTGLKPETVYGVYQRIAATEEHGVSQLSRRIEAVTEKAEPVFVPVERVVLSDTTLQMEEGSMAFIDSSVVPENATDETLTWTSSNPKVAAVDGNGRVAAKAPGTAVITAAAKSGVKAACKVTVVYGPKEVTGVKLDASKKTLGVKESFTLKASLLPTGAMNEKLTFTSSNKRIATVNSKGKVTAKRTGKAAITVKTANGKKAICRITVKKAPTSLKLNAKKKTLKAGKTFTLKATRSKGSAGKITFTSSNKKVVSVSSSGKIRALKKGRATITAKTYNGKKAKIVITVKK